MASAQITKITRIGGDGPALMLTTVLAPDEQGIEDSGVQSDLKHFHDELHKVGLKVNPKAIVRKADGPSGGWQFFGDFILPLAQPLTGMVGVVVGAWFQSRAGRKVRLKVGDIEVEARTAEEVEQLVERAKKLRDELTGNVKE